MNYLRRRFASESDSDSEEAVPATHKSRKPPNTAFRQQRLKAWQPILTPKSVIPMLFVLAVIFAPLGIAILHTVYNVEMLLIDYTQCHRASSSLAAVPQKYTHHHFRATAKLPEFKWAVDNATDAFGDTVQTCRIQFEIPHNIKPPVYLYYQLTNFYQNHRKYVESYDLLQLLGKAVAHGDVDSNCKPLRYDADGKIVYPCGLIANSLFNDTFLQPKLLNSRLQKDFVLYNMTTRGILWRSDRDTRYKRTRYNALEIVPPPNWRKMFPQGYNESNLPNLQQWEHLQNWMRTAGLPSFYKLYLRNLNETLSLGTYEILVELNYPTQLFGGTKLLVLTTNLIFGGRDLGLGVVYVIVAVICLVLAVAFLLQHLIKPRRIGDHTYLHSGEPRQVL